MVGHNAHLEGCVIESGCLIGSGSITLNRVVVGKGSVVAAGAVVPEGFNVPPGSLVAGVPATIKRSNVDTTWTERAVQTYIETAKHHRTGLRRLQLALRRSSVPRGHRGGRAGAEASPAPPGSAPRAAGAAV